MVPPLGFLPFLIYDMRTTASFSKTPASLAPPQSPIPPEQGVKACVLRRPSPDEGLLIEFPSSFPCKRQGYSYLRETSSSLSLSYKFSPRQKYRHSCLPVSMSRFLSSPWVMNRHPQKKSFSPFPLNFDPSVLGGSHSLDESYVCP